MEGIVEKLCARFPELRFEYCKAPHYISCLIQCEGDIIICCKAKPGSCHISQNIKIKTSSDVMDQSSYFGNPLEVPYSLEESMLNITLVDKSPVCDESPLTSFEALQVKNFCNMQIKPAVPVVILCDSDSEISIRRVLHGCHHHDQWICHSWADYYKSESSCLPTLNQLRRTHCSMVTGPNGKNLKYSLQMRCQSVLCVLEDITDRSLTCCKISAQFDWSELTIKPPLDSNTNASLIVDSHMDRAASVGMMRIWKQLVLLQTYVDILEKYGDNSSGELQLPSAQFLSEELGIKYGITEETVNSRMKHIMFPPLDCDLTCFAEGEPLTLLKAVDFFSRPDTPGLEFTDILWINLIGCDSYRTLKNCFKELFTIIGSSRQTKSQLRKTNISSLAHLLSSDKLIAKCLDPLEFLVEMGIEKLCKELLSIFDSIQMGPSSLNMPTLPRFSELSHSECWIDVSKGWLTWLARLYSSLNVLFCVETVFHSPPLPLFFPLAQEVVKRLSTVGSPESFDSLAQIINNPTCSFCLPITMELLNTCAVPDTEVFDDWSMTLRSSNEYRKVTSIFYRSLKSKFPYVVSDITEGSNANNMTLLNSTCPDLSYMVHCVNSHSVSDYFSSKCDPVST